MAYFCVSCVLHAPVFANKPHVIYDGVKNTLKVVHQEQKCGAEECIVERSSCETGPSFAILLCKLRRQ